MSDFAELRATLDRLYPQPDPPAADGPMADGTWPHWLGLRDRVMELGR